MPPFRLDPSRPAFVPTRDAAQSSCTDRVKTNSKIAKTLLQEAVDRKEMTPEVRNYYLYEIQKLDKQFEAPEAEYNEIMLKIDRACSDDTDPDTRWKMVRALGKGGCGNVTLWQWTPSMGKDANEKKSYMFAVKETGSGYGSWHGYYRDYCSEGELVRRLNAKKCANVAKVYDWISLKPPANYQFRILFDCYSNGDLSSLARFYGLRGLIFPEGFLWHIFFCMTNAILYCANGRSSATKSPDWETILHRDIKAANVFIGSSQADKSWPWPEMILGDFGLAHTMNSTIASYKSKFSAGTKFYMAPEVPYFLGEFTTASDVDCMGKTMKALVFYLLRNIYSFDDLDTMCSTNFRGSAFPYTIQLLNTITDCTDPNPSARPSVWDLLCHCHKRRLESSERANRLWYQKHHIEGKDTWPDQVLWRKADRNRYRRDRQFRKDFLDLNNWKRLHLAEIAEVKERTVRQLKMLKPNEPRRSLLTKEEREDREGHWYREKFGVDERNDDPLEEEP